MTLSFTKDRFADVDVLRPQGRITIELAPDFRTAVDEVVADSLERRLVLDFGGVDYISSGGLRVVASGARQCRAAGGQLAVAALTSVVEEIFTISRFHQVVPIHPTVEAALAALSGAAAAAYTARPRS